MLETCSLARKYVIFCKKKQLNFNSHLLENCRVIFEELFKSLKFYILSFKYNRRTILSGTGLEHIFDNWLSILLKLMLVSFFRTTSSWDKKGMLWNGMGDNFSIFHIDSFLPFHFQFILKIFHSIFHSILKFFFVN